jgi:hypothetical protein
VTGNVCFGGYSAHAVGKTLYPPGYGVYSITSESMNWPLVDSCIVNQSDR